MGGGGDAAAPAATESAAPASTPAAAPATAAAATPAVSTPAAPAVPDPVAPWVEAAESRKKIPYWAIPVLALPPLWAVIYALTLDPPTPTEPGALELGAETYAGKGCSGCHGAGGAGVGAVPGLTDVTTNFANPGDMVSWVALGTAGYQAAGIAEYGPGKPVGAAGQMPAWADSLTAEELMTVVLHERVEYGGDTFDAAVWQEGWEEAMSILPTAKADEYTAILDEWVADPPA